MSGDRALLLMRMKARQKNGVLLGDQERACHMVPVADSPTMPEFLVAYCGLRIAPGKGEVVPVAGMSCELYVARSPAFAILEG